MSVLGGVAGLGLGAVGGLTRVWERDRATRSRFAMLHQFTQGMFEKHRGSGFEITFGEGRSFAAELVEVNGLGPRSGGTAERDPFSVVFRVSKDARFPQRIYRVAHREMGVHDYFLVPVGPDGDGMRFEAVFS